MFNSKYSKVLTVILIIAIVAILGLLIFMGIGWYQSYMSEADVNDVLGEFDDYVGNVQSGTPSTGGNTQSNTTTPIEPNLDLNNVLTGEQTGSSGGSTQQLTYKGFKVVGRIQIPKTDVDYPILEKVTPKSIEAAIGMLYGPGINQVGNTVLIGHNFRNGTFFSNNSKLSKGDKIYITGMDGKKVTYEIYHKYQADTNDFDYAVRDTKGKREISLSTCTNDTKYRLIIWAKEV